MEQEIIIKTREEEAVQFPQQFGIRAVLVVLAAASMMCGAGAWWMRRIQLEYEELGYLPPGTAHTTIFFGIIFLALIFAVVVVFPLRIGMSYLMSRGRRDKRRPLSEAKPNAL